MKKDIILSVSKDLGISPDVVEKVYKAYWLYIKTTIEALPLKEDLTEEEFSKLRTNFNIGSLGKLFVTYKHYVGIKKRFEYLRKIGEYEDRRRNKD